MSVRFDVEPATTRKVFVSLFAGFLMILLGGNVAHASTDAIDKVDTLWVIISTALVMFMTPGLALFYAGMARKKNVLGTIMHSFFILCLISVQWVLWGYTLSFGEDVAGIIGGLEYLFLNGVGTEPNGTIPHLVFMMFQGMFAVITVALITGGFAERVKFSAVVLFSLLWATLVYNPLCHWVWGGGWLGELGVLDFAGGIVVHMSCGISALVAAIMIGSRRGYPREPMPPHNLALTVTGMAILWFGWFGFNAGSALAVDDVAINAFIVTNTAASVGAITWLFIEWFHRGRPTLLGAVSGAVAGLGSITPAAGFVGLGSSILIGFVGGVLCYWAVIVLKPRLGYDDSLDVFGIHGVGGTWGTLAIGLFGSIGTQGVFFGGTSQLVSQLIGIGVTVALSVIGTAIIIKIVDVLCGGFRVSEEEELEGLDLSQHGESGYIW